jgi:hypothetical protein
MDPDLAVRGQRAVADERRQLAGGAAPGQIHLEETILRVDEARGPRDILAGVAANRGDAERVSSDRHRRREAWQNSLTIDLWQAAPEFPLRPPGGQSTRDEQDQQGRRCQATYTLHRVRML